MAEKNPKHSLASYAYEKDWFFMTDLIDSFRGTGYSEKEWAKRLDVTKRERSQKKFWRR